MTRSKKDEFVSLAGDLLDQISVLVDRYIPQKGDVPSVCSHVALKNAIGNFDQLLSGLSSEDLIPDPAWYHINSEAGFEGCMKLEQLENNDE